MGSLAFASLYAMMDTQYNLYRTNEGWKKEEFSMHAMDDSPTNVNVVVNVGAHTKTNCEIY